MKVRVAPDGGCRRLMREPAGRGSAVVASPVSRKSEGVMMIFLHGQAFEFSAANRAVMGDFVMGPDQLLAELRAGSNLARPELQRAMLAVMQSGLIGAGMDPGEARGEAFHLLHNGAGSFERASQIVLKILGEGI